MFSAGLLVRRFPLWAVAVGIARVAVGVKKNVPRYQPFNMVIEEDIIRPSIMADLRFGVYGLVKAVFRFVQHVTGLTGSGRVVKIHHRLGYTWDIVDAVVAIQAIVITHAVVERGGTCAHSVRWAPEHAFLVIHVNIVKPQVWAE